MQFLNFNKKPDEAKIESLEVRVEEGDAIEKMVKSKGWGLLNQLLNEQLDAYKVEMLIGCKSWDEYQDKRGKAWGIRLMMADVEDYISRGKQAQEELNNLKR